MSPILKEKWFLPVSLPRFFAKDALPLLVDLGFKYICTHISYLLSSFTLAGATLFKDE
jgi:hypothetical protein